MDRVIFRRWRHGTGGIVAVLPDEPANPGMVLCYEHVGQHAEGNYSAILAQTISVKLTDPDVQTLFAELTSIGYSLIARKRLVR